MLALELQRLLAAGRFSEAAKLASGHHEEPATQAAAHHALGLAALHENRYAAAVEHLQRATDNDPSNAWYWCNLCHARYCLGDFAAAIAAGRHALNLKAVYPQAEFNLGCAELAAGDSKTARRRFQTLVRGAPDSAEYRCALGDACRLAGAWRSALGHYRKALAIDPNLVRAKANLGALLVHFGSENEALAHCRRAVELMPDSPLTRHLLGICLYRLERLDEAMEAFADAYEIAPTSAALSADIGRCFSAAGDQREAAAWFAKALSLAPGQVEALSGLARIFLDQGDVPRALAQLQEPLKAHPDHPELLRTLAEALWNDGDADGAIAALQKAAQHQPHNANLLVKQAQILASAGRQAEAESYLRRAHDLNPRSIPALSGLAVSRRGALEPALAEKLQAFLAEKHRSAGALGAVHAGLAHYYDGLGEYKTAAQHMRAANRLQWAHRSGRDWRYRRDRHARYVACLKATFNAEFLARVAQLGRPSLEPVFVVGMPRSGTTLTEQILARHPAVLGIGERPFLSQSFQNLSGKAGRDGVFRRIYHLDAAQIANAADQYLARLADIKQRAGRPDAVRVVDKMPDNYALIGWIVTLFPRAKIIHLNRDLRDVALSCWLTQFGKIQWASRFADLQQRIADYRSLMAHWRAVLPGRFLEIDYEKLVSDPETGSRQLIDWLELDWHPACLEPQASDRLVRTASINQVRQPVHNRSIGRWRYYAEFIPELAAIEPGP